jgi:hypothetical protein
MKLFSFAGIPCSIPSWAAGARVLLLAQYNRKAIRIEIAPHYGEIAMQRIADDGWQE